VPSYPVNLQLEGRKVLVVGGGPVALRKVEGLLEAGAVVTVIAPSVIPALRQLPVALEERRYERRDASGYRLVIAATGDPDVNQAVHDDAEADGIWVNAADDPARCTFTLPSVLRRGIVQFAVSTGGASPALSAWLRRKLAATFGPELAEVAESVAAVRRDVRAQGRSTEELDWEPLIEREVERRRRRGTRGSSAA
jgi:precorrin-2 dehydrogenase / sirohydrochlorin ferrochelatase